MRTAALSLALALFGSAPGTALLAAPGPNLIVIYTDDHGKAYSGPIDDEEDAKAPRSNAKAGKRKRSP